MVKLASNPVQWVSNWIQRYLLERVLLRHSYERMYLILGDGHKESSCRDDRSPCRLR